MTDNEIIKALEAHFEQEQACKSCTLQDDGDCCVTLLENAYDLINRQKAEIERYKGVISILENDVKVASIEAVKGFAHFLIDRSKGGEIEVVDVADLAVEYMNRLGGKGNEQ